MLPNTCTRAGGGQVKRAVRGAFPRDCTTSRGEEGQGAHSKPADVETSEYNTKGGKVVRRREFDARRYDQFFCVVENIRMLG
jgi:hypothetical protein